MNTNVKHFEDETYRFKTQDNLPGVVMYQPKANTHESIPDEEYQTNNIFWTAIFDNTSPDIVAAAKAALGDAWPVEG